MIRNFFWMLMGMVSVGVAGSIYFEPSYKIVLGKSLNTDCEKVSSYNLGLMPEGLSRYNRMTILKCTKI